MDLIKTENICSWMYKKSEYCFKNLLVYDMIKFFIKLFQKLMMNDLNKHKFAHYHVYFNGLTNLTINIRLIIFYKFFIVYSLLG